MRCRESFAAWCDEALPIVAPDASGPASHQRRLIQDLQWVDDTPGARLMVLMPPGSAKSTYASVLLSPWFIRRPNRKVIEASHTMELAEAFSGRVQGVIRELGPTLGYGLRTEAKGRWAADNGAEYLAAGVTRGISGFRADLAVIDDPVKGAEAADSETQREAVWQWFTRELRSRLKPDGRIVLVMTRWHEDDLGGRLLRYQPEKWRVVKIQAIAGADDPLGREPGEWLWGDDAYGYADLLRRTRAEMETEGNARNWSALYQQDPSPAEGLLFKVAGITTLDAARPGTRRSVRAWDLAATVANKGDPDWTCGVKLSKDDVGSFTVDDVVRFRGGPEEVERTIKATASRDGKGVTIGLPQDPGQAGKAQVLAFTKQLAGYNVVSSPETGDKATRAGPVAAQCNVGNLSMMRATWNAAFVEELRDFPTGRKDDQVDALSRAFAMLIAANAPANVQTLRL